MATTRRANSNGITSRLAKHVRASRQEFAQIFDEESRRQDKVPITFNAIAQVLRGQAKNRAAANPDESAFVGAFRYADNGGWLGSLLSRGLQAGLFRDEATSDPVLTQEFIEALKSAAGSSTMTIQPEAYVNKANGFVDIFNQEIAYFEARHRVCQVVVKNGSETERGTGFLVGPQRVLTNWHVVRKAVAAGKATDYTIEVVFGRVVQPRGDGTELLPKGISFAASIVKSNPAYEQEYNGALINTASEPWNGRSERLDFALLRLEQKPGLFGRHWYDLSKVGYPEPDAVVNLVQFPLQEAMKVTAGNYQLFADEKTKRRIRHNANSAGGSSGGLCLSYHSDTGNGRAGLWPSALHQGEVVTVGKADKKLNQAIPLATLARKLKGLSMEVDGPPALLRLTTASNDEGAPVLGRAEFQSHVTEALLGKARIIITRVDPALRATRGIGRSFSTEILRSLAAAERNTIVELRATDIGSDERALAGKILGRIEGGAPLPLPKASEANTTHTAWIADHLIGRGFAPRLIAAAGGRLVWLVIDDLDTIDIPDGGGRRFLDALYQNVATMPPLRIVLIGLKRDLPSIDGAHSKLETLRGPPGVSDIEEWLARRLGEGGARDFARTQGMAELISWQVKDQEGRAKALSDFIRERIDPILPNPGTSSGGERW